MKRLSLALTLCLSALLTASAATRLHAGPNSQNPFGVGLELGGGVLEGTEVNYAVTGKYWMNAVDAVDMELGGNNSNVSLGSDYLWHNYKVFNNWAVPLYYGAGGYANIGDNHLGIGARGKIGVDCLFPHTPWELYAELVPSVNLLGGVGFGMGLNLGGRFYF